MKTALNIDLFSSMVKQRRGEMPLRDAVKEIGGIGASTLSRIESGGIPDVETFIKVCQWLGVSTDTFVKPISGQSLSNRQKVLAYLNAETALSRKTIGLLVKVIEYAYEEGGES